MIWKHAAAARRFCLAVALFGVAAALGGCSEVPDAVNPVSWYHGIMDSGSEKPAGKPNALSGDKSVPNADKPYPSIASVPDKPPQPSTAAERAAAAKTLIADNADARYTDMQIRRQTDESAPPPSTASSGASSAPAPAPSAQASAGWPKATPMPAASGSNWPAASPQPAQNVTPPPVKQPAPPVQTSASMARPAPTPPPTRMAAAPHSFSSGPIPQVPAVPPPAPRIPTAPPVASTPPPAPAAPASYAASSYAASRAPATPRATASQQARPVFGAPPPDIYLAETMPAQRASPARSSRRRASRAPPPRFAPPPSQFADGVPASVPASPYGPYFPAGVPFVRGNADVYGGGLPGGADGYGDGRVASIYFRNGSARLGSRDVATIRRAVRAYRAHGGLIVVVGHASAPRHRDTLHSEVANFSISLDRANAVAREIMRLGVNPAAVRVRAMSDAQQGYGRSTSAAASRRADILIE